MFAAKCLLITREQRTVLVLFFVMCDARVDVGEVKRETENVVQSRDELLRLIILI